MSHTRTAGPCACHERVGRHDLGDGRNKYGNPEAEVLQQLYAKAKRVVWLNPEAKPSWNTGDSEMKKYAAYCHQTEVCNSLIHLERVVSNLMRISS